MEIGFFYYGLFQSTQFYVTKIFNEQRNHMKKLFNQQFSGLHETRNYSAEFGSEPDGWPDAAAESRHHAAVLG